MENCVELPLILGQGQEGRAILLGNHGGPDGALPTLQEALPSITAAGGQNSEKLPVLEIRPYPSSTVTACDNFIDECLILYKLPTIGFLNHFSASISFRDNIHNMPVHLALTKLVVSYY
ncbi:hypothetical protein J5N97_026010 [Dioscorea zingiberensis]|uniref:Uncharacterized protein n=1 Tax=Dioscorea zingiberensis TaxID=325984 RepID=A0A9D5C2F1_9LILI|nr:hypothetical protein J5N97_026010 [Dioscorea zingiberensis]